MKFFIVFSTYDEMVKRSITFYRCVKDFENVAQVEQWAKSRIPQAIRLGDDDEAWAEGTEVTFRPLEQWIQQLEWKATALDECEEEDLDD